jgi:hypothetical protein
VSVAQLKNLIFKSNLSSKKAYITHPYSLIKILRNKGIREQKEKNINATKGTETNKSLNEI